MQNAKKLPGVYHFTNIPKDLVKEYSTTKYPETLDVDHIKEILGIGRRQAYELANSGQFHVVRIGKRIKISKDVFFQWLKGGEA